MRRRPGPSRPDHGGARLRPEFVVVGFCFTFSFSGCCRAEGDHLQVLGNAQKFEEELTANLSGSQGLQEGTCSSSGHNASAAGVAEGLRIVGSRLCTPTEVFSFRRRWDCLASRNLSMWQRDPTPRLLPWASPDIFFSRFQNMGRLDGSKVNEAFKRGEYTADPGSWPAPESVKYKWILKPGNELACGPHPPSFQRIDAAGFCSALRRSNGSFFIVGDSMTAIFVGSFIAQLSAQGEPITKLDPTPACSTLIDSLKYAKAPYAGRNTYAPCMRWRICGHTEADGGIEMHFVVSCHLQWVHSGVPQKSYGSSTWCYPFSGLLWGEEMVRANASIVLLNRGLHFVPEDKFKEQLNYTLREVRRLLPDALLVYRSTTPGHPNCSAYSAPVEKPLDMSKARFNWQDMEAEDVVARELVEGEAVNGVFLDLYPMHSLRPDGHFRPDNNLDCLHYRIPGPADSWPPFLTEMIKELV